MKKGILSGIVCVLGVFTFSLGLSSCKEETHTHMWELADVLIEATCEKEGVAVEFCDCGKMQEAVIPPLGHKEIVCEGKSATCLVSGYAEYVICERCEYTTYREILALGHDFSEREILIEPKCETMGLAIVSCSRCEEIRNETVPKKGHALETFEVKTATCVENGWNAYEACKNCDYTTKEEILGEHDLEEKEGYQAERCGEVGWDAYLACKKCEYTTKAEYTIPHNLADGEAYVPEECLGIGWDAYEYCQDCAYSTKTPYILSHELEYVSAKASTCQEEGWNPYEYCKNCEHTTKKVLEKTPHNETISEEIPSTCVKKGQTKGVVCKDCKEVLSGCEEISVKPHSWGDWVNGRRYCGACGAEEVDPHVWDDGEETSAPSCETEGIKTYTCSHCQDTKEETIPALGHKPVSSATCKTKAVCSRCGEYGSPLGHDTEIVNAQAPDCENVGWNAYEICKRCDHTTYGENELPANGHSWNDGVDLDSGEREYTCTVCGKTKTEIAELPIATLCYEKSEDGTYYICIGTEEEKPYKIVIPDVYKGLPVKRVKENAFYGKRTLISVTIGANIEKIGDNAFYRCTNLVEVLNNSTLLIEKNATNGCVGAYVIPGNGEIYIDLQKYVTYRDETQVLLVGYLGKETALVLSEDITEVNPYVFSEIDHLTSVRLSAAMTTWTMQLIWDCPSLEEVILPANITKIETLVFGSTGEEVLIKRVVLENTEGWLIGTEEIKSKYLINPENVAKLIKENYKTEWACVKEEE